MYQCSITVIAYISSFFFFWNMLTVECIRTSLKVISFFMNGLSSETIFFYWGNSIDAMRVCFVCRIVFQQWKSVTKRLWTFEWIEWSTVQSMINYEKRKSKWVFWLDTPSPIVSELNNCFFFHNLFFHSF